MALFTQENSPQLQLQSSKFRDTDELLKHGVAAEQSHEQSLSTGAPSLQKFDRQSQAQVSVKVPLFKQKSKLGQLQEQSLLNVPLFSQDVKGQSHEQSRGSRVAELWQEKFAGH